MHESFSLIPSEFVIVEIFDNDATVSIALVFALDSDEPIVNVGNGQMTVIFFKR